MHEAETQKSSPRMAGTESGPQGTVGRMTMKSTRRILGHTLPRSLVRSLTHSGAHGKGVFVHGMNASISYSFDPLCGAANKGITSAE